MCPLLHRQGQPRSVRPPSDTPPASSKRSVAAPVGPSDLSGKVLGVEAVVVLSTLASAVTIAAPSRVGSRGRVRRCGRGPHGVLGINLSGLLSTWGESVTDERRRSTHADAVRSLPGTR